MKKVYSILSLIVLTASILAQENESLLNTEQQSEVSYSGYGGPLLIATGINNEFGFCIGGKGGAVFNEKLVFGVLVLEW